MLSHRKSSAELAEALKGLPLGITQITLCEGDIAQRSELETDTLVLR